MAADVLNIEQAYAAMYHYLCGLYEATRSDDLGSFLGDMSLLNDHKPADPAVWNDWLKAVEKAKQGTASIHLGRSKGDIQE